MFTALEAGAWNVLFTADTIFVATLPTVKHIASTVKHIAPRRLHNPDGPAFAWYDMELYYLNGVPMEPWMVMDNVSQIDTARVLGVANVDQRRELIRRVGITRVKDGLPIRVIDTADIEIMAKLHAYQLLEIDLSDQGKGCRFLEMRHATDGAVLLEGVNNGCNTVQEAINWRATGNKTKEWSPSQLT